MFTADSQRDPEIIVEKPPSWWLKVLAWISLRIFSTEWALLILGKHPHKKHTVLVNIGNRYGRIDE